MYFFKFNLFFVVDVRKYFCQRVVGKWNNLSACDDNFRSITTFKRFLSTIKI